MNATRCLRDEHQVILKVLDCLEMAMERARDTSVVSATEFAPLVEFFRGYADRCHHAKEEDRLFPRMEEHGVPREGGPIGVMLYEHEQGRMHVRTIDAHLGAADGGDPDAAAAVLEHGDAFLNLLRGHINKEDNVLFNMADALIQDQALAELNRDYEEAEADPEYCERLDGCRAIADRLFATYGVQPVEVT